MTAKLLMEEARGMDIELARTFLTIVEAGSFVRAAERLNITQTAVSARVRSLEDQLRRPVFLRNKSGAALTTGGRAIPSLCADPRSGLDGTPWSWTSIAPT